MEGSIGAEQFFERLVGGVSLPERRPDPVNVFTMSRFPRRETVASNVLAFFLDPLGPHRLGTAIVDALAAAVGASPTLSRNGVTGRVMTGDELSAVDDWTIETEAVTRDLKRIDILLTSQTLDFAIAVENKLDAAVANPFESYVTRALENASEVWCLVLSPSPRGLSEEDRQWVSAELTYDSLFDAIRERVALRLDPDRRSLDILEQFMDNLSERRTRMDHAQDALVLDAYWQAIGDVEAQVPSFFRALSAVNDVLRRRGEALCEVLASHLPPTVLAGPPGFVLGIDRSWGRNEGRVTVGYIRCPLVDGNVVELVLGSVPGHAARGLVLKAYPLRGSAEKPYADFDHVSFGVPWTASDAEIAEAFARAVGRVQASHPLS